MPKGPSPYFLFCDQHRAAEKAVLVEKNGSNVSVAEVAKSLGEKWRNLTDEERLKYKELASAQILVQETEKDEDEMEQAEDQACKTAAVNLPIACVRRAMMADKEICRISADALLAVSGATNLFLEKLASDTFDIAKRKKRKTVRCDDLQAAIKYDKRLNVIGLKDVVASITSSLGGPETSRPGGSVGIQGNLAEKENDKGRINTAKKQKHLPAPGQSILSFFK